MRTIAPVAVALAGMSLTSAFAAAGSWCGTFRLGSISCGYSTRGVLGLCPGSWRILPSQSISRERLWDVRRELESSRAGKAALSARQLGVSLLRSAVLAITARACSMRQTWSHVLLELQSAKPAKFTRSLHQH